MINKDQAPPLLVTGLIALFGLIALCAVFEVSNLRSLNEKLIKDLTFKEPTVIRICQVQPSPLGKQKWVQSVYRCGASCEIEKRIHSSKVEHLRRDCFPRWPGIAIDVLELPDTPPVVTKEP